MKKAIIFLIGILCLQTLSAQIQKTDSIYNIWNQVGAIAFSDQYLYVKTEAGLRVIDYSDIENPTEVLNMPVEGNLNNKLLKAEGNYLYSNYTDGIEIFDITDRLSPVKVGDIIKNRASIINFVIVGDYVLCTEYKNDPVFGNIVWLVSYDVSNKSAPVYKYSEQLGSYGTISDFLTGDYIFVRKIQGTYPMNTTSNHLYSVASPAFPTDMGEITYFPNDTDFFGTDTIYKKDDTHIYGINLIDPLQADTFAVYGYDGMADGFLNVLGESIIMYHGESARVYTTHSADFATYAGIFELPAGDMQFRTVKENRLYYPQTDSASIVNLSLVPESQVNSIGQLSFDKPFDLNNFTIKDIEGGDFWQIRYCEQADFTEAYFNPSDGTMPNRDWLISPSVSLPVVYQNISLIFSNLMGDRYFENSYFKVLVSENYDGNDPEAANWTTIPITTYDIEWDGWDISRTDLSAFKGKDIHIAFKFDNPDGRAIGVTWRVRDVRVSGLNAVNVAGTCSWQYLKGMLTVVTEIGHSCYYDFDVNEDWLTTPALDLSQYTNYFFSFSHHASVNANQNCGVYVSENYDGITPADADWAKIETVKWPKDGSFLYSGTINLSAYTGKTIHIGFKYYTTPTEYSNWYIKDMKVLGANGSLPHSPEIFNMNPVYYNMPKITGVRVNGNQAFVSHLKYSTENNMNIPVFRFSALDLTDRENIVEKTYIDIEPGSSSNWTFDYYVKDSLLAVHWDENRTNLYRFNTNNEFEEKGSMINQDAYFHYVADHHAVVSLNNGVCRIYDLTDETNPLPVFQFTNTYDTHHVAAVDPQNKHLYLSVPDGWNSKIEKWDISDMAAPVKLQDYGLPYKAVAIYFKNNVFYNYRRSIDRYGIINAYEISGSDLIEKGSYEVRSVSPSGLAFNDNYAFMGVGANTQDYDVGIHVISLQDPANLERKYLLPDNGTLVDLSVNNDVLTAAYPNTLELYDLNSIPLPPESFDLLSPQGVVSTTDTILMWNPSVDPNGNVPEYQVWIADNDAFTNAVVDTTSETSLAIGNLLPGQSLYWKVIALDEFTENVESNQVFQFNLPGLELASPTGEINSVDTLLIWKQTVVPNGSLITYEVLWANDAGFTNPDTLSTSDTTLMVNGLLPGQHYYWKVRAKNDEAYSLWSAPYKNFSVSVPKATLAFKKNMGTYSDAGITMLDANTFYTASSSSVYRYDGSGNQQYMLQVNGQIKSSTTITPDHKVYIASTDNNLYAFNQNGVSVTGWPVALGAQLEASVAVDDNHNLYLGTSNGIYQCVSAYGEVLWSYNVGGSVKASSAITNGDTLYIINSNGRMLAFDLVNLNTANPQPAWTLETNHPISNSPAILNNFIFVSSDDGYLLKIKNNGNSGTLEFEIPTHGASYSSPVIDAEHNVYFASDAGMVYSVNGDSGSLNWESATYYTRSAPEPIYSTGTLTDDGMFLIGDSKGVMYCFDTSNGDILWSYRGETNPIKGALLYSDNSVYYNNGSHFVSITEPTNIKSSRTIKNNALLPWGTFQGNKMRTGNLDYISSVPVNIEENGAPNISVYPNPVADNQVFIQVENLNSGEALIQVLTVSGVMLDELSVHSSGRYKIEFDYPEGIYMIKLIQEGSTSLFRVIQSGSDN